jgi:hypothetical protein
VKKDINWKTITTKDLAALIYQHLKNDGSVRSIFGRFCRDLAIDANSHTL